MSSTLQLRPALILGVSLFAALPFAALANESYEVTIRNHRFEPEQIQVPAGKKFKLVVKNLDSTPEEFESHDLKREKVIAGKSSATINLGPLKPGTYRFVGEFHEATAKGEIVAR